MGNWFLSICILYLQSILMLLRKYQSILMLLHKYERVWQQILFCTCLDCQWWDMNQIVMTVLWEAWCRQRCNLVNKYYLCHRQYLLHLAEPMKGNWSFKKIISFQTIGFVKRNHISWQTTKNISNLSSTTSSYDRPGKATSHYHL